MNSSLTATELESLQRIPTPTISNALERLGIRASHQQTTDSSIRCIFPELGGIVGYACTLKVRSAQPRTTPNHTLLKPYWDHFRKYPAPRIVIAQELDQPPAGAYWGEVNSNIHRALGCVGLITSGTVRDLDEVRALGFPFFAAGVSVSHAYAHVEEFDVPVQVGGLTIRPGDLLHADQHGAILIPHHLVAKIAAAAQAVEAYERPMINLCKSPEFSTARLDELMRSETI